MRMLDFFLLFFFSMSQEVSFMEIIYEVLKLSCVLTTLTHAISLSLSLLLKGATLCACVRKRETDRASDREREWEGLMKVIFLKCIWEIWTYNPSLAVKILNATPRPILCQVRLGWKCTVMIILEFYNTPPPAFFRSNFCILCMPTTFV